MGSVVINRQVLRGELETMAAQAGAAAQQARALRDSGALNEREQVFAVAMVRGARGLESAARAMLMELRNAST